MTRPTTPASTVSPSATTSTTRARGDSTRARASALARARTVVWDVDGTGLREIEDKSVAQKIRDKVNAFNGASVAISTALTIAYMAIPLTQ